MDARPAAAPTATGTPVDSGGHGEAGAVRSGGLDPIARAGTGGPGRGGPPAGRFRSWIEQPAGDGALRGPILRRPTSTSGHLAIALLGWAPLGVFAAAAIDQATGCGRYAASCASYVAPATWIMQAAIILLLLAVPVLAGWSAHGAMAALLVGLPSAVVLSAAGGTNVRDTSGPILLAVLAMAYLGGIAYAVLVRRRAAPPDPGGFE
jgi:hypothetical protein